MLLFIPVSSPGPNLSTRNIVVNSSWSMGALSFIDSVTVKTGSRISYSTSIRLAASSARWTSVAATAATACPMYRTFSEASTFSAIMRGLAIVWVKSMNRSLLIGKSFAVITAFTPGSACAFVVSSRFIRA